MSNSIIGEIYRQVVERVIKAAETDFEEGGYTPQTLQELKSVWEQNLSKLHVAHMPWDPPAHQIAPPAQQAQMSAVKSEAKDSGITPQNGEGVQVKTEGGYDSQIKQEPKYDEVPSYPALNGYQGNAINPMAGHRAANQLLQQFGTQANASIRAAGLPQQPRPLSLPGHQQQQQPPQQQRAQQLQLPGQPQQAQQANRYPLGSAQNDGVAEDASLDSLKQQWDQFVLEVRNTTSEERAVADGALKQLILGDEEAEESQLMIPDNERRIKRRRRPQRARDPTPLTNGERMQVDGGDESADEDAINSDLDDSEEDLDGQQAEEDGPLGEMILCTWDKVNRVKNKWRCTLKDGILTTGGKEYVFHKATGEFEW